MLRFLLLILITGSVFADQVKLANGDRLSGRVQRLGDGKLLVHTEMAGDVTIPWSNVATIISNQPLYVVLKNGTVLSGTIVDSGRGMRVENSTQTIDIARDEVISLRSYPEQQSFQVQEERRRAPHFRDPWVGFIDTGISVARGNADVTTISVGGNGVRTTKKDKLTLTFNSLYARNSTVLPISITADLKRGGARYERNFTPRDFSFVSFDAEADALQQLEIRSVAGAGYGRHVVLNKRNTFDLFGGATANREIFTHERRLTGEALLSEESSHKVTPSLTFKQKITMFPSITEGGQYRLAADSTAVTTLLRWLSWQVSVSDRYISNPVFGTKRNDILVTTGFRLTLLPPKF